MAGKFPGKLKMTFKVSFSPMNVNIKLCTIMYLEDKRTKSMVLNFDINSWENKK